MAGVIEYLSGLVGAGVRVSVSPNNPLPVAFTGSAGNIIPASSTTGTQTSVVAANADTALLAANPARLGFTVFNDSTAILYLLVGSGAASLTVYTVQVPPGGYFESFFGFTGPVRGFWSAVNGSARVTEYT